MDIDKDDLAVLTTRMTKEEVDRVYRLLHEWRVGPEMAGATSGRISPTNQAAAGWLFQ